jgi:hypothetical protein
VPKKQYIFIDFILSPFEPADHLVMDSIPVDRILGFRRLSERASRPDSTEGYLSIPQNWTSAVDT